MIGLLPAAGQATRFNGFPKFLLPIGNTNLISRHYSQMIAAGAQEILIASSYQTRPLIDNYVPFSVIIYDGGQTMSESVLKGRKLAGDQNVLMGMPDTYWGSEGVYSALDLLLNNDQRNSQAIVALWKIRPEQRGNLGQVKIDQNGTVWDVVDKDPFCSYEWAWGALAWKPSFWEMIDPSTPHVGYALKQAIKCGVPMRAVMFHEDRYFDCGSFRSYAELCASLIKT